MTDKIPEALAVLDEWISLAATPEGGVRMNTQLRKARAAFAELIDAANSLAWLAGDVPVGYIPQDSLDSKVCRVNKALAAVEKLP